MSVYQLRFTCSFKVCDWQRFDVHKDLTPEILSILFAGPTLALAQWPNMCFEVVGCEPGLGAIEKYMELINPIPELGWELEIERF